MILLVYYSDGALRLMLPARAALSKQTMPPLASYLITSARLLLKCEQKRHPQNGSSAAEGDILVKQMICKSFYFIFYIRPTYFPAYMYREAPFNVPCADPSLRLTWWQSMAKDSNGYVLAVSLTLPYHQRKKK
jgi:hypothetical protein